MKAELIKEIQNIIDNLEKAKKYLAFSQENQEDEMKMLSLGYLEKAYSDIYDIKIDMIDGDD